MVISWIKRTRATSKLLALDRKYLQQGAQRALNNYLDSSSTSKEQYRRALALAARQCRELAGVQSYWVNADSRTANGDAKAAIDASQVAVKFVTGDSDLNGKLGNSGLLLDTFASVAVAYRFAAGMYEDASEMQRVGNAAFMLLNVAEQTQSALSPQTKALSQAG